MQWVHLSISLLVTNSPYIVLLLLNKGAEQLNDLPNFSHEEQQKAVERIQEMMT